jgi:hypothetical protein
MGAGLHWDLVLRGLKFQLMAQSRNPIRGGRWMHRWAKAEGQFLYTRPSRLQPAVQFATASDDAGRRGGKDANWCVCGRKVRLWTRLESQVQLALTPASERTRSSSSANLNAIPVGALASIWVKSAAISTKCGSCRRLRNLEQNNDERG